MRDGFESRYPLQPGISNHLPKREVVLLGKALVTLAMKGSSLERKVRLLVLLKKKTTQ